ncbi:MAG TPA: epoxide hydrolase [Acidimicrobiia bacterium]|nr:epoxide hydrolase [Acidimicrobiia bacterium]
MGLTVEPFPIDVPDPTLDDLRDRLDRTRLPNQIDGIGWDQGTELDTLRDLLATWRERYDWRRVEDELNRYEHVQATIDGQRLHALHARSRAPDAIPLLLVHGWPGSIVEFLDALPGLTDAFHVVAPSLPGYGFSGPTTAAGWNPRRIAAVCSDLMAALGYTRYGAQGGDWGSIVCANVADLDAEHVLGLHLNFVIVPPPADGPPVTPDEQQALTRMAEWSRDEVAYQQIQGTRPQTLGYGLEDSPSGLAAWILEKFRAWSGGGDALDTFSTDRLLDNVTLYWVTRTATSSTRLYWEMRRAGRDALPQARVEVPTGIANYPAELTRMPRAWVEHRYNVTHWVDQPRGGHFAAMQVPDLFVDDLRSFFGPLGR